MKAIDYSRQPTGINQESTGSPEAVIIRLTVERDQALRQVEELKAEVQRLADEKSALERKLRWYENPHVPPSVATLTGKATKKKKDPVKEQQSRAEGPAPPVKRGAPLGHRGATRETPVPDEVVEVTAARCPGCARYPGEPHGTEIKTIEELPPPPKITVTRFELKKYKCIHCGLDFTATHGECPTSGTFGPSLLTYMTLLKVFMRAPLRKTGEFMEYHDNFQISPKGILDAVNRVGKACKGEHERLKARLREAKWVHVDETGFHVNGQNWWLWVFRSDQDVILLVIVPSRGRKVVKDVLGKEWKKPLIVDGWTAYKGFPRLQRCWAHLLREVEAVRNVSAAGKELSEEIHQRFKALKEFTAADPPVAERQRQKQVWETELAELVERHVKYGELRKPVTYLRNGLEHWYTCLLHPGMPPTNNPGEQALRESVIIRKIIGTFRSESGTEYYQYIASLLATWRFTGQNMAERLEQVIRSNLCFN